MEIHRRSQILSVLGIGALLLAGTISAGIVKDIRVFGNARVRQESILEALGGFRAGMPADTAQVRRAVNGLMASGWFDTVYASVQSADSGDLLISVYVREFERRTFLPYGGSLNSSMLGAHKYWLSVMPGVKTMYLFNRLQRLDCMVSFPYSYGTNVAWSAASFPATNLRSGLSFYANTAPYKYSPYYAENAGVSAYIGKPVWETLVLKASASYDIATTWAVDVDRWRAREWQIIVLDPDNIEAASTQYPKTESTPSLELSATLDRRNHYLVPTRGFYLYIAGSRFWVDNRTRGVVSPYNQATGIARGYLSPFNRQTFAVQVRATARQGFDNVGLRHRLLVYDNGTQFRGFQYLYGTNIAYLNIEYRYQLFEMDYGNMGLEEYLNPAMMKFAKRISYSAFAFAFLDNGLFWGYTWPQDRYVRFVDLDPGRDAYTSMGVGASLVYPRMGYMGSAGVSFYSRKPGLSDDYRAMVYGSLSTRF